MIYVITISELGSFEWELEGYVKAETFPVQIVDKIQKKYGNDYHVTAEEVKELSS